jgi:uncharacterized membrane protein YjjP (DUF1212 family)
VRSRLASLRKERPARLITDDVHDSVVAAMLRELGIALLEVEQPTHEVESRLTRIATLHTDETVRVVAQPNALWIQVGTEGYELAKSSRIITHLDMAGRVEHIADLAAAGAISPADALAAVATARTLPPRFGAPMTVLGYTLTTIGFGMSVNPTWTGVALVPGALSFVSLSRAVTGTADFDALQTTVGAIFSIALGTLVGSSVFDAIDRLIRRRGRKTP